MKQLVIYPEKLQYEIVKYKRYIPRRLKHHERLKLYHRYYNETYGNFKVKEIYFESGNEYYYIAYNKNMNGVIQYPEYNNHKTYELLSNKNNMEDQPVINNRIQSFTGAEIKFWFLTNDIDFSSEEYSGFYEPLSYDKLYDTKRYRVRRNKKLNIYEFIIV